MNWNKGLISGIVGGIVLNIVSFILSMIPWMNTWYAQTFPQMITSFGLAMMVVSLLLVGLFMGLIYSVVRDSIPGKSASKGINYGFICWLLAGTMWPIMMISFAPTIVWVTELIADFITFLVGGIVVALLYERK